MANITRIKAGESKEKNSPKNSMPEKNHQEKSAPETTSHTQQTKVSTANKKLTKLEKAQQKYEKKQAKKQAKLEKKANKKPIPKVLRILTAPFRKIGDYFHASWQELRQVRWPNRKMTWKLVSAVIIYTVVFAIFIMLLDAGFTLLFNNLLK
jgi:preprotein translocase, secE subunit